MKTFGCGKECKLSIKVWCTLVRQAWLIGFLDCNIALGGEKNRFSQFAFATYTITDAGNSFLAKEENEAVMLPGLEDQSVNYETHSEKSLHKKQEEKKSRKGTHALYTAQELISD